MPEPFTDRPILTVRFERAMLVALEHHRTQRRKGTEIPYVAHLLAVTAIVLEMDGTEDEAIAALLHDMVEDDGGQDALSRIELEFDNAVAGMVKENSDSIGGARDASDWRVRKEGYLAAIPGKTAGALRVSLADKLHNARSIVADLGTHGDALWRRFNAPDGATDVFWYYDALTTAFEARRDALGASAWPSLDELRRTVDAFAPGHPGGT